MWRNSHKLSRDIQYSVAEAQCLSFSHWTSCTVIIAFILRGKMPMSNTAVHTNIHKQPQAGIPTCFELTHVSKYGSTLLLVVTYDLSSQELIWQQRMKLEIYTCTGMPSERRHSHKILKSQHYIAILLIQGGTGQERTTKAIHKY